MRKFFVLALGRSGTAWLARLLQRDPTAVVHHEPDPFDVKTLSLSYAGRFHTVVDDILRTRFDRLIAENPNAKVYGEVNSYLRYESEWLISQLGAVVVHLVRDGRSFVRSAYPRWVYSAAEAQLPIVPADDDPFAPEWSRMDRFERLCWYWQHTNDFLSEKVTRTVRFEDILHDFDKFRSGILDPAGLNVSREQWLSAVQKPINTSSQFWARRLLIQLANPRRRHEEDRWIPHPKAWTPSMNNRFWEICGPVMEKLGYQPTV